MPWRFVECLQMGQGIIPLRLVLIQCKMLFFPFMSTQVCQPTVASIHTSCGGIHVDKVTLRFCRFLAVQSK